MHPAYSLSRPAELTTSVVVASPHSGRHYPRAFLRSSMLDERSIRSSEDAFMDLLVEAAPGLGAPLLAAEYPRAYIDLNRSDEELDPGVIEGVGRVVQTPRISSGSASSRGWWPTGARSIAASFPGPRPMTGSRGSGSRITTRSTD
jgi:N-formylglutamate amidohydrolase